MMLALTTFWNGLPKGLRDGLAMAGMIVVGLILGRAWIEAKKDEARQKERARATAETIETVHEIEKESVNDADEAIEARDTAPVYPTPDSVPEPVADRIFRD